eukprot:2647916-Rhodomonas_salina.2
MVLRAQHEKQGRRGEINANSPHAPYTLYGHAFAAWRYCPETVLLIVRPVLLPGRYPHTRAVSTMLHLPVQHAVAPYAPCQYCAGRSTIRSVGTTSDGCLMMPVSCYAMSGTGVR